MASRLRAPRVTGEALTRRIASATAGQPAVIRAAPPATLQINFRASEAMARALAELATKHGSMRLAVASLMQRAGIHVPAADLAPPPGRRRLG